MVCLTLTSCEKDNTFASDAKEPLVKNKSMNNKSEIDFSLHRQHLKNMITTLDTICPIDSIDVVNVHQNEFNDELILMQGMEYYDVFADPISIHKLGDALSQYYINGVQNPDLSHAPAIVETAFNKVISEMPSALANEIPRTYNDLMSGNINGSNYVSYINDKETEVTSNVPPSKQYIVEVYYGILKDSYEFWVPESEGGEGNAEQFDLCYPIDGVTPSPEMNDNDWPNELNNWGPDWLWDDVITGGAGAVLCFCGWGGIVSGAAGSLTSAN